MPGNNEKYLEKLDAKGIKKAQGEFLKKGGDFILYQEKGSKYFTVAYYKEIETKTDKKTKVKGN